MRTLGRALFYGLVATLWLIVGLAGIEGWARWQWRRIETHNPYVLSRQQHALWPIPRIPENDFSAHLADTGLRNQHRGQGKSLSPLPQPDPQTEMTWRIPLFFEVEGFERQVFSNVYGIKGVKLDADGLVLDSSFHLPFKPDNYRVEDLIPAGDVPVVMAAMADAERQHGKPRFFGDTSSGTALPFPYCIVPDTQMNAAGGWLLYPNRETWEAVDQESIWELPFFTYKKHAERRDRISALGITEDFYINNYGFRDADLAAPGPADSVRILCVGASTTEEGPTNDLTYPAILEFMLNQRFDTNRIEVVNCGISGMNSLKHRMRIADYLALNPDIIVVYNAVNDICHDLFPIWVKDATPLQQRLRRSTFFRLHFGARLLPSEARLRRDIVSTKMTNLDFLARYAQERGVQVALCSFAAPTVELLSPPERDYYEYYTALEWGGRYSSLDSYLLALRLFNEELRRLCDTRDLIYIPVAETLRGGAILFGDICHLRNPGIERKAAIIADAIAPRVEAALARKTGN